MYVLSIFALPYMVTRVRELHNRRPLLDIPLLSDAASMRRVFAKGAHVVIFGL